MKQRDEVKYLHEEMRLLEEKQAEQLQLLKEQFHVTVESLKPFNLVKNTLAGFISSPAVKTTLADNAIGMTTGYLAKLALMGVSRNPITKIAGALLQFVIGGYISKHSEGIKSTGEYFLKRIFKKQTSATTHNKFQKQ
jgi:hypothetical protein